MAITYQKELFGKIMPELPEIFYAHWQEIALEQKVIKLEPDWNRYVALEINKILHVMTVRDDGILVGYYFGLVMPHLHYKSSLTAWSDLFFVLPSYRAAGNGMVGVGYQLFKEVEKMLKNLGVQRHYVMTKKHLPLNMLMKRLRYKLVEKIYTRLL